MLITFLVMFWFIPFIFSGVTTAIRYDGSGTFTKFIKDLLACMVPLYNLYLCGLIGRDIRAAIREY